jgi:uncharacterized damage-inducible protein DinB
MPSSISLRDSLLHAWNTNNRVTIFLVEHITAELWQAKLPDSPRRAIGMIAAHLHNSRCTWINTLGREHGIVAPRSVNRHKVKPKDLAPALRRSGAGILRLLEFGCDQGGRIPGSSSYVWRNLPLDVGHVLTYFVAHEGHHRGQIIMLARQLGLRLPAEVVNGLWLWSKRSKEI